ncbi:TPA: hypothetical protein ACQVH3_004658 [Serratia marcescens]
MTLQEWVDQQGGVVKCSKKHGFISSTLGAWCRLERFPRATQQARLLNSSKGLVDISALREAFLAKQVETTEPVRQRRLQGSLVVRSLERLKQVFDEQGLPRHRCNLNGPGLVARWSTTHVTVQEVRNAIQVLADEGRDAGRVEDIHAVIRDARKASLRSLES